MGMEKSAFADVMKISVDNNTILDYWSLLSLAVTIQS